MIAIFFKLSAILQYVFLAGLYRRLLSTNNQPLGAFSRTFTQRIYRASNQDASAIITLSSDESYRHEFTYGSAYLSQSSRTLLLPATTQTLQITTYQGKQREVRNDLITTLIE